MRPRSNRRRPAAAFAGALLVAFADGPPAAGQEPAAPPAGAFGERIEVELVDVEVWVTDREGRPVRGLTAADFEVRHDGEPVEISHFREVRSGEVVPAVPATAGEAPAAAAPAHLPTHLIVYFDQSRLEPGGARSTVEGLRSLLAGGSVPPERVLVLRQDAGLHLEAPFGSSAKEIDAALDRVAAGAAAGMAVATEVQLAREELLAAWEQASALSGTVGSAAGGGGLTATGGPGGGGTGGGNTPRAAVGGSPAGGSSILPSACDLFEERAQPVLDHWIQSRSARIAATLANLDAAAGFLAALPGVKTLLYVSDGLDIEPGTALASLVTDLCPAGLRDHETRALADSLAADFRSLARRFNANRVTIHALQGSGLTVAAGTSAGARGGGGRAGERFDSRQRQSERSGLSLLAGETGGRAVFDRNDLGRELDEIGREMGDYYSLAYPPPSPRAGDAPDEAAGREHRIEVALADRSLAVRHRRGILTPGRNTWMDDRLAGALHLGVTSNPLDVRLGLGDAATGASTVRLYAMVPVARLVFVPAADGEVARLELRGAVQSSGETAPAALEREFRLRKPPGAADERVSLPIELTLEPGAHRIAIGLRDANSGEASFVTTSFEIGP